MYLHIRQNNPTAGGTDGQLVSETITTTLTANNTIGDTSIAVANSFGLTAGMVIKLSDTESTTISAVSGNTLTVSALTATHVSGDTVINASAGTNPIMFNLTSTSTGTESSAMKLAICTLPLTINSVVTNYVTGDVAVLTPMGTAGVEWALALDNSGVAGTWGAYGAALTIPLGVGATNTIFWIKAKVLANEAAQNDVTVKLNIACANIQVAA
jgi:hypothetical protein